MRHIFAICLLGALVVGTTAQEPGAEPIQKLAPPAAGAKPLELDTRIGGFYSAVSKLKNFDTRDGIGVRWNWPKELGKQPWGDKGAVALVAFPNEPVAFGKHRGFAVRLVNRGKTPVVYCACDSALYMVQEARDEKGRWREIEDLPWSTCGNSYHDVPLAANEYWEFAAPAYAGTFKTKIRFRLGGSIWHGDDVWVYSNEFDGAIARPLLRMGPTTPEIRRALESKDAKEAGVVRTLIELLAEDTKDRSRSHLTLSAVEHLAELGPGAKEAMPALRKFRNEKERQLRANAAYALWRVGGNLDECVKTLVALLDDENDQSTAIDAARLLIQMGPPAKDAVPALCRAMESDHDVLASCAMGAVGNIQARADIAVPALVKALTANKGRLAGDAAETLGELGVKAKPAVPALNALIAESKEHRVEAAFALWKIEGKTDVAVPVLIDVIKTGYPYRAAQRLGDIGPPAKAAVPELARILKNDDYGIIAAGALWKITREPEPTLSTLIRALEVKDAYRDPWSAIPILEEMGPQAKAAVPALLAVHKTALTSRHESLRAEVEAALRKIDPEAAKRAGIR